MAIGHNADAAPLIPCQGRRNVSRRAHRLLNNFLGCLARVGVEIRSSGRVLRLGDAEIETVINQRENQGIAKALPPVVVDRS